MASTVWTANSLTPHPGPEVYALDASDVKDTPSEKEIIDDLKAAGAALAALPDSERFQIMRTDLLQTISDCKAKLGAFKPLGKRLDAAQDALTRARKRHQDALDALALASSTANNAAEEVASIENDVAKLQTAFALSMKGDATLSDVSSSLTTAVEELCRSAGVPVENTCTAKNAASAFIASLKATLDVFSQKSAPDKPMAEEEGKWKDVPFRRRPHIGKTPPTVADMVAGVATLKTAGILKSTQGFRCSSKRDAACLLTGSKKKRVPLGASHTTDAYGSL